MAAFDVSDVVNITQDRIEDGQDIIDPLERRKREEARRKAAAEGIPDYPLNSLICLAPKNPFRRAVMKLVHHNLFSGFIIATIIANCVFLAINNPICSKMKRQQVLDGGCS